jgi:hypothetical protein
LANESNKEISAKILDRFQHIFDCPLFAVVIPQLDPAMGAPPRKWIPKAIVDIEKLIESGVSINESCRRVAKEIAAAENIEAKTVEMTYRRHQRTYWHEEFCRCIVTKDIEAAIIAFKRLTKASKDKLKLI